MARPIEYDPKDVLDNAMMLFWRKGYESTSIQDIVKATGLQPGSLYNIYRNKEGVFKAVLEYYKTINLQNIKKILDKNRPLESIEVFLNEIIVNSISDEETKGCLFVKTLLVLPSYDDDVIHKQVVDIFIKIEQLLKDILSQAVQNNQTNINPDEFAKLIVTIMFGSHVYIKSHRELSVLKTNVNFILTLLKNKIP